MSSPTNAGDGPEQPLVEFFAEIESGDGAAATADDRRDLVAALQQRSRSGLIGLGASSTGLHAADADEMLEDGFGRD